MVSEKFKMAILRYRARGGKLYRLAWEHRISPSLLSATMTGARPCTFDPRVTAIGLSLGLQADEVFERPAAGATHRELETVSHGW